MKSSGLRATLCVPIIALYALACSSGKPYEESRFSYPPKKTDATYTGTIRISSQGEPEARNQKTVNIIVKDKTGATVLDDKMTFLAARVEARVVWKKAAHFKVIVREKGDKTAADDYNKKLVKSGPRTLSRVNYWYDSTKGKFR